MYLVDTSVWIDYFREKNNSAVEKFHYLLDRNIPFGLNGTIYQEILQGAGDERDYKQLKEYLESQRFYHPKNILKSHEAAAMLFLRCRKKGITIRSSIDCYIAQTAIEHKLLLLHNDKDFEKMHSVVKELTLA